MSRERENARFITPSPNVENFLARENSFADRDSEGTRLRFLSGSRSAKLFSSARNFATSGSGL
jgi:hypothetical protein